MRSQIRCEKCDYRSDTFDETFTFNLPLPKSKECTFGEALEQFKHFMSRTSELCRLDRKSSGCLTVVIMHIKLGSL